jgi:hypothetical protein
MEVVRRITDPINCQSIVGFSGTARNLPANSGIELGHAGNASCLVRYRTDMAKASMVCSTGREMKHKNLRWNPGTWEWFCTKCGRTSKHVNAHDAQAELDQYECKVPSVKAPKAAPGTETVRLIRKPFKMTLKTEQSGSRFVMAKTDDGRPLIRLELFHDTVSGLRSLTVGFEMLSGTTLEQGRTLVDLMNERIVGVIVTPK